MTTGTLTGTYQFSDGSPKSGSVNIAASVLVRNSAGNLIVSGPLRIELDGAGSFSTPLVATDDTTVDPTGVTYTVSGHGSLRGIPIVRGITILAGQTVDMADVIPVDPAAPQYAAWTYGTGGGTGGGFDDAAAQAEFVGALTW